MRLFLVQLVTVLVGLEMAINVTYIPLKNNMKECMHSRFKQNLPVFC